MNKLKLFLLASGISVLLIIAGFSLIMFPILIFTEGDQETTNIGIGYLCLFLIFAPMSWLSVKKLIKVA